MSPQVAVPVGWHEVAGVFVGGCVARGDGSSFRARAHAHTGSRDPYKGWICVRSMKRVYTESGKATKTMYHEYAHILQPSAGHGLAWQKRIAALGFPSVAAEYAKRNARRGRRAEVDAGIS